MSPQKENSAKENAIKGSNKFLHPKSRKCKALVKQIRKESKKEKSKMETKLKQSLAADKLLWFQKNMEPDVCPYTIEKTCVLVKKYINRNDEELEQIRIKRSIGGNRNKQHIGREDAIRITKERELRDFESCGLEIPNILNSTQCNMLRKWSGDLKFLPNFKFCYFSKRQVDEEMKKKEMMASTENMLLKKDNVIKHNEFNKKEKKNEVPSNAENLQMNLEINKNDEITFCKENEEKMDIEENNKTL